MTIPIPNNGKILYFLLYINKINQKIKTKNPSGRAIGKNEQIIVEIKYFFLKKYNKQIINSKAKTISVIGFAEIKKQGWHTTNGIINSAYFNLSS
jgi:hypothetical protein